MPYTKLGTVSSFSTKIAETQAQTQKIEDDPLASRRSQMVRHDPIHWLRWRRFASFSTMLGYLLSFSDSTQAHDLTRRLRPFHTHASERKYEA